MIVQKPLVLKVNGFSHGLSRYQIFSYITLFLQTLLFSSFIVPNFIKSAQITLSILYYVALAIVAIAGFKATITDPTDELVYMERRLKLEGKHVDETLYSFQCNSCETSVNENSKHCRVCDRCVKDFDHHCIWINNCVSKKNYNAFLIATIFLTLATGVFAIAGLLFIIDYYTKALGIVLDNTVKKGDKVDEWKAILMVIFTIIAGVVTLMCMRLIIFHMYLIRNKITTYDYIMQKREQKSDTKKIKVTQEIKLTKVAPLWTVGNKTPENDEENINVKSHSQRSERQSTERGILPETHITLGSGVNTRRGSKTSDNKITSIDNANLRKELAAEQLKEGEDGSGKKWRFRVFQNRASPPKYSNLMSPTNLEYVTSAELGRHTPLSGDPTGSRGSPIGDNDHRNFDSKFSTPVPNEDSDEKEGQEKITSD